MSVEWLTWAYKQRVGDSGAKAVLVALCNYANPINPCDWQLMGFIPDALKNHLGDLGFAWPSQELLATMLEMGERTVRRHICTLEERDLILGFERRRPDGRKSSQGYLLITSPANFDQTSPANFDQTSPANFDQTSPANLAATYEDTQGLIQKEGVITPTAPSVNKTPLPPFRVSDHLRDADWPVVYAAIRGRNGQSLSVEYFMREYDAWISGKGIEPRYALNHFLDFIQRHKERNKL
jgi:hypothetical protein